MPRLGTSICACARTCACAMACEAGGGGGALGIWLESVQAPGLPEASQRSPRWRRDCRSSSVLEAECECGGARGPRGGNPGLQCESGPRPPAPRGPGGAGAAGGIQESGRAAGAKGPLLVGKKPRAPGIPRWSPIQDPNQARPCLASEIRREDRKSTRLNSSHHSISYAVFCLKKKKK